MSKGNNITNKKTDSTPSNVTINHYPAALLHEHVSAQDGSSFHSISFKYGTSWASFIIDENSFTQSVRRNGDPIPDRVDIFLGASDDVRSVSIRSDSDDGGATYASQPMFNSTICSAIATERKDYLRSIAV